MADAQVQLDELLALKSIFESDLLIVDEATKSGRFLAHVRLPRVPFTVSYSIRSSKPGSLMINGCG